MNKQVGVIEFPDFFPSKWHTSEILEHLHLMGMFGRIVGWGIWQQMNLALRDIGPRGAEVLSQELPLKWRGFTIRQSGKVRWSITRDDQTTVIWDLWNWVKRSPKQGETARALYLAIKSVGSKMGVVPRGFYGNGNLASPILRQFKVNVPVCPEIGREVAQAFFGGRIQSIRIGRFSGLIYEYDLNSAYAWGMSQLPEVVEVGRAGIQSDWRLVDVEWDIPAQKTPIYPFPVRDTEGRVEYPRTGRGWHWSPLYDEAKRHFGKYVHFRNHRPLTCTGKHPFSFIHDLYATRREMTNPLENSVAKWTLSALWGKLCQRPHGRPERQSFRSLMYAGMATSLVNAELFRIAMNDPSSVWSFGVDSIISTNGDIAAFHEKNILGDWKCCEYNSIEAYQPGFWRMRRSDGTWKEKTRGVPEGKFDWEEASKEWKKYGSYGRVPVSWEEFVGLSSLEEGSDDWLNSKTIEMAVLLRPGGLKGFQALQRAGAGASRIWAPPDRVEHTGAGGLGYGVDHSADRGQSEL